MFSQLTSDDSVPVNRNGKDLFNRRSMADEGLLLTPLFLLTDLYDRSLLLVAWEDALATNHETQTPLKTISASPSGF